MHTVLSVNNGFLSFRSPSPFPFSLSLSVIIVYRVERIKIKN